MLPVILVPRELLEDNIVAETLWWVGHARALEEAEAQWLAMARASEGACPVQPDHVIGGP